MKNQKRVMTIILQPMDNRVIAQVRFVISVTPTEMVDMIMHFNANDWATPIIKERQQYTPYPEMEPEPDPNAHYENPNE